MIDDQAPQTPAYNLRKRQTKATTSSAQSSKPAKTKATSTNVQPKKKAANYESDYDPESGSESSVASVEEYNSEEEFKTDLKRRTARTSGGGSTAATAATTTTAQSTKRANKPKIDNAPIHIDLGEDEVRNIEEFHKKIVTPFWLLPDQMMDKNKKMMHEEGYDPTSVFIPEREFKRLSGLQQRYWEIKKNHFDQMVLFKFGVFYYIYHNDALIAHRLLDLRLNVWGKRFSVFFHETHLKKYATRLVEQGHKVAVVEQMENAQTKEDEYAKREVVQVLTRGTFSEGVDQGYSPRFCLCLFEIGLNYGLVFLDTTTHEFYIGEFQEDIHKGTLKTLLTRLKPMEIVYLHGNLSEETLAMCKSLSSRPTMNPIHNKETLGLDIIIAKIEKYFQEEFPEVLDNIRIVAQTGMEAIKKLRKKEQRQTAEQKIIFYPTLQALSLCMTFLERIMLAETVFKMGNFLRYDIAVEKKSTLYLDSQALESLEIFEVGYLTSSSANNNNTGSLFDYMDKTVTDFGKRMLRRWMMTPLLDPVKISERLDAVDDLLQNPEELGLIQSCLKRLPDIERSVNKVYNLSNKKRMSALYFEDFAKNRLKDFLFFLEELEKIDDMVKSFQGSLSKFHSKRLKQLITFKPSEKKKVSLKKKAAPAPKENDEGEIMEILSSKEEEAKNNSTNDTGVFPSIGPLIKELKEMVQIVDGLPMPAEGTNDETDKIMKDIKKVKAKLASILDHERRYYGFKAVNYVHTKYRYELEIPEAIVKASKRPENYVITSKKQGFLRFHTPSIEECIQELEEHERELQKVLVDFIVDYFKKFYDHNLVWRQVVTCLGELDCISGLARLATTMNVRCRPNVLSQPGEGEKSVFVLKDMVHPSLAAQMEREAKLEELSKEKSEQAAAEGEQNQAKKKKKKAQATQPVPQVSQAPVQNPPTMEIQERFVRNDVVKEDGMDIFLITGPNMGGKSTLLRQTALAVIMAQMGSFVPAREFTFNVVDRVFTRIGAGDKIFEGKSTFFLEMEETSNIVREATRHSLLVMDELGRGTSTYDGVSLAYATLKYVSEQIKCLTLFATHYHILLEEFQLYKNVKKYFMLSYYNEQTEDLRFTYKFIEGSAERSHSYVIAKMAGLPQETLVIAKERAAMMTKEKENMDRAGQIEKNFNKAILTLKSFKKDKEGVKSPEDILSVLEGLTA